MRFISSLSARISTSGTALTSDPGSIPGPSLTIKTGNSSMESMTGLGDCRAAQPEKRKDSPIKAVIFMYVIFERT